MLPSVALVLSSCLAVVSSLDPDALSQRYRNWTYSPTWVIPPTCLNPETCAAYCNASTGLGCTVDVFQVVKPDPTSDLWLGVYTQFDHVGYETYGAFSTDLVNFNLSDPGILFSPRAGRPPNVNGTGRQPGDFDYGVSIRLKSLSCSTRTTVTTTDPGRARP